MVLSLRASISALGIQLNDRLHHAQVQCSVFIWFSLALTHLQISSPSIILAVTVCSSPHCLSQDEVIIVFIPNTQFRLGNSLYTCNCTAMAEALAVIGLVSAIVQFVDFGNKIVSRVSEFQSSINDVPKSLRDTLVELPLLLDTLKRTKEQAEDGQVDKNTQKALLPIVSGCQSQVEALNDIVVKMLPRIGDSSWKRGVKAFSSVRQERASRKEGRANHQDVSKLHSNFDISRSREPLEIKSKICEAHFYSAV